MSGDGAIPGDASDARKRLAQNRSFENHLRVVGNVLIVAAAALCEVRAGGGGALGGRRHDLLHAAADKLLLALHLTDAYHFFRQHVGHKNGAAVLMAESIAAVHEFFNLHLQVDGLPPIAELLGQIEQTQPSHAEGFEQPLLNILPLQPG